MLLSCLPSCILFCINIKFQVKNVAPYFVYIQNFGFEYQNFEAVPRSSGIQWSQCSSLQVPLTISLHPSFPSGGREYPIHWRHIFLYQAEFILPKNVSFLILLGAFWCWRCWVNRLQPVTISFSLKTVEPLITSYINDLSFKFPL